MNFVEQIKQPIISEIELFEEKFKGAMLSKVPLLNRITYYIVRRKGKQMRPMFVFLVAKMVSDGGFDERTYRGASVVELIHTATLVHDDVVDESNRRRGFFSLNAIWKNKIAVLVGDFLLSRGLLLAVKHEEFELLKIMSTAVQDMSEGELLQIEKARKLDITEKVYFDIIRQKTATLIAACCASGANSVGEDKNTIETMRLFGEKAGIAFQIKDDLFDYTQSTFIGKPTGIDIREQKMTLPLIYTLNNVSKKEKNNIINIVKNYHENDKKVAELIELVKKNGGLNYAENVMIEYRNEALEILNQFDDNEARRSLELLLNYVVNRKK